MKGKIVEFIKDESGQTSTEYILLLAIVGLFIMKFGNQLEGKLTSLVDSVFSKIGGIVDNQ